MGFMTKKCSYCGMELNDHNTMERMGQKFCSDEHANKYWEYKKNSRNAHGGC
jgi:hypothetical protein